MTTELMRLKLDLAPLAAEILSKIPDEIFESEVTIFLDPSMGSGQFILALMTRLRAEGHSDENIKGRLFGWTDDQFALNYGLNKHKLIGNFTVGNFLEDADMSKKFDVVIGNPPYQSENEGERNIGAPLWPQFIDLGSKSLNLDGILSFVTPATWLNRAERGAWGVISKNDVIYLNPNVKHHFPGIGGNGGTFCFFLLKGRKPLGQTLLPDGYMVDLKTDLLPRNNRNLNRTDIEKFRKLWARKMTLDVKMGPTKPSIKSAHWSEVKTPEHKFETYYSGAKNRRSLWCDQPIGDHGKLKLVVASSGNIYQSFEITNKGVGRQANYVLGTPDELEKIQALLLSEESILLNELMMEGNFNNALKYIVKPQ